MWPLKDKVTAEKKHKFVRNALNSLRPNRSLNYHAMFFPLKGEKQGVMIQETSSITEILIKY